MCGICGQVDFHHKEVRVDILRRMCHVLAHRGPDDEGMVFLKDRDSFEVKNPSESGHGEDHFEVGLGHRRLSIIDLSTAAHQPMCNEDGSIWIVFNGEIYNFKEVKERLAERGHLFRSKSDTEVILHSYEEWGVECLYQFRGMFAFAIWDSKLQRLFMARDRLGKKPLVYFHKNGHFAFASEIKALLQLPDIEKKVSDTAIHHYLTYQYIPSPETIFEGIKKLPPAHYLLYDRTGKIKIERYWRLNFNSTHKAQSDTQDIIALIRTELENAVKLRLISDVPLGAFLSGGVDSSLIVGIMAHLAQKPVKTFSIGFQEKEFDELPYARMVSDHFGTEHHEFIVKPDAIELLPKLVWHYDEPFADSSAIPTYYVASLTKDFVKVVLTGDAGDENFAGYPRYLRGRWVASFSRIPPQLRRGLLSNLFRIASAFGWKKRILNRLADFMESLSTDQARNYCEQIKVFNGVEKENVYTDDFRQKVANTDPLDFLLQKFDESHTEDFLERLLYVDINSYLPEDLLVKMDIATMANSLEARVPFLDHKFMELVAGIPSHLKLHGFKTKFILKKAFKDFLPKSIFQRKKMGFGVPLSRWFRKELKGYAYEVLLDRRTLNRGYFRREGIQRLLDEHVTSHYDHSARIWALLCLETWFRIFMDKEGSCGSIQV